MGNRRKRRKNRRRNNRNMDWRKPGYNRSNPRVVKVKEDEMISYRGPLVGEDKTTKWHPISEDTFEELKEKGALTEEQIQECERRFKEQREQDEKSGKKSGGHGGLGWLANHPNRELIEEMSKLDFTKVEDLKVFKGILEKNPKAADLIGKAEQVRRKRAV